MSEEVLHFKMNMPFLFRFMLQKYHEDNYDQNDAYTRAFKYSIADLLYGGKNALTDEEIEELAQQWANSLGVDELTVSSDAEQREQLFKHFLELPKRKELEWQYVLQGKGEHYSSIIDLRTKKEHAVDLEGMHAEVLLELIMDKYVDEYLALDTVEEQNDYVFSNFKLIREEMAFSWYVPNKRDIELLVDIDASNHQ